MHSRKQPSCVWINNFVTFDSICSKLCNNSRKIPAIPPLIFILSSSVMHFLPFLVRVQQLVVYNKLVFQVQGSTRAPWSGVKISAASQSFFFNNSSVQRYAAACGCGVLFIIAGIASQCSQAKPDKHNSNPLLYDRMQLLQGV